jgi:hypothetical protein
MNTSELFSPENCYGFYDYNNICMNQYCSCVAECASLSEVNMFRDNFMVIVIIMATCTLIAGISLILYNKNILSSAYSTGQTTVQVIYNKSEHIIPTFINMFFHNKLTEIFFPTYILDTASFLIFICNLIYFVQFIIQPEYTER